MKKIAEFNTDEEFRGFVTGLSETEIRNFQPSDWNQIYCQAEKAAMQHQNPLADFFQIRGALIYNSILSGIKAIQTALHLKIPAVFRLSEIPPHTSAYYRQEFIKKNAECFYKLYKNFHLPSDISRSVIQLARSSARSFLSENAKIKQQIIAAEKNGNFYSARHLIKKVTRSIYKNAYPNSRIIRRFSPNVYTTNSNDDNILGSYFPSHHQIRMREQTDSPCTLLGHELYHALQELTSIHNGLSKLNINLGTQPREMGKLYRWNHKFYCPAKLLQKHLPDKKAYQTYARQPEEYTANLFSFAFTREVVRLCNPQNFRTPCRRPLLKLLHMLDMPLERLTYTPDGKITISISSEKQYKPALYSEFGQKYLPPLTQTTSASSREFMLEDNEDNKNFLLRQTVALYKLRRECRKNGTSFLQAAFPQTFDTSKIDGKLSDIDKRLQQIGKRFSRCFSDDNNR